MEYKLCIPFSLLYLIFNYVFRQVFLRFSNYFVFEFYRLEQVFVIR